MSRHLIGLVSVVALLTFGAPAGASAAGANPCAPKNPCAAKESKNPCAVKRNPCAAPSAGAAKNPCASTK